MVRVSASGSEGRGFAPRPRHTKGVKNGTGSSLADARNKRVVLRSTMQVGICYSLCRSKSSTELMLSISKRDVKQSFFIFIFMNKAGFLATRLTLVSNMDQFPQTNECHISDIILHFLIKYLFKE